jgi:ComF family protein
MEGEVHLSRKSILGDIYRTRTALLDLIWPRSCDICGGAPGQAGHYLCWDCQRELSLIQPPFCTLCGDPVEGAITRDYICSLCVDRRPAFDQARSVLRFKGGIKDVLHRFKYSNATHMATDLAALLHVCVSTHYAQEPFDAVSFVPLHPTKERARTYNQARLLAEHLAKRMDLPLAGGCLARTRETGTQTRLNMRARVQNVANAFAANCPEWIEGRNFLLVDDVMTTGATCGSLAKVLKDAGAARVCVVTVARG